MSKRSVLIADGDPLLLDLLSVMVEQDAELEVIGKASEAGAAVQLVAQLAPDLVLLDEALPPHDGLRVLERIVAERPDTRVLVMTGAESDEAALRAFRLGAKGSVPKQGGLAVLPRAIRAILDGEPWLERRLSNRLIEELARLSRRAQERPEDALSAREREVLGYLGRGMTNAEIARVLFLSLYTVKIHVSSILRKLNVPNRTEAAVFAMKRGLVPEQPPAEGGAPAVAAAK